MTEGLERPETGDMARRFVLQVMVLYAAVILSYLLLEGLLAPLGAAILLLAYILFAPFLKNRAKPESPPKPFRFKFLFVLMLYGAGGYMTVVGVATATVVGWIGLAYSPIENETLPVNYGTDAIFKMLSYSLAMLVGGMALLALSILLLHLGRGGLAVLAGRLRRHGPGLFLSPWFSKCASVMLVLGGSIFLTMPIVLGKLANAMAPGRPTSFPDMAGTFLFLPTGMFATVVLAVALVGWNTDYSPHDEFIRVLREDNVAPRPPDTWWTALTTITVTAAIGSVGAIIWMAHVGIVGAMAAVPAMVAGRASVYALDSWVYEQSAAGRSNADIAAAVNEKGYWTSAEPDKGLPEFLPEFRPYLEEDFAGFGPKQECRIKLAAAPTEPKEDDEFRPVRYCVRSSCSTPAIWDAAPAISLSSSHPSQKYSWMTTFYIDLFAEGVAAESGGYCTAEGALAKEFQG